MTGFAVSTSYYVIPNSSTYVSEKLGPTTRDPGLGCRHLTPTNVTSLQGFGNLHLHS